MIQIGEYHNLKIERLTDYGLFLENEEGDEVLLPNKYMPQNYNFGDMIKVFVYLDHEERPVATNLTPFIKLDEFASLRCVEVSKFGAFMDWGLEKHLFVPFKEQPAPFAEGYHYLIFCYLDEETERLVGSAKVHAFLDNSNVELKAFEEVNLIVSNKTELGFNAIVNKIHLGLIYHDDIFKPIKVGDRIKGIVKKLRPDNKIDIGLEKPGYRSIEPNAQKILDELKVENGFLNLSDKSNPELIKKRLQMSKKSFKKAAGSLYKQKLIEIKEDGLYLKD